MDEKKKRRTYLFLTLPPLRLIVVFLLKSVSVSSKVTLGAGDRRMRYGGPERGTTLRYRPRTCVSTCCVVDASSTNVEVHESCVVREECKGACWVRTG